MPAIRRLQAAPAGVGVDCSLASILAISIPVAFSTPARTLAAAAVPLAVAGEPADHQRGDGGAAQREAKSASAVRW